MKKILTRITPHSAARLVAVIYGLLALPFIPIGIGILIFGGNQRWHGLVAIIAPLLYVVMGYVFIYFTCWIYNQLARFIGGIEVEVEDRP